MFKLETILGANIIKILILQFNDFYVYSLAKITMIYTPLFFSFFIYNTYRRTNVAQ